MNCFRFFSNFWIFFTFELRIKNHEILICFRKKTIRTTLKKFLDNRSKRFGNTTQTFFDKRRFRKLEKKSEKIHIYRTNQF